MEATLEDLLTRIDKAFFGLTFFANTAMGAWRGYAIATGQPQPPAYDILPPLLFGTYLTSREAYTEPYTRAREALTVFGLGLTPSIAGETTGYLIGLFTGIITRSMS